MEPDGGWSRICQWKARYGVRINHQPIPVPNDPVLHRGQLSKYTQIMYGASVQGAARLSAIVQCYRYH